MDIQLETYKKVNIYGPKFVTVLSHDLFSSQRTEKKKYLTRVPRPYSHVPSLIKEKKNHHRARRSVQIRRCPSCPRKKAWLHAQGTLYPRAFLTHGIYAESPIHITSVYLRFSFTFFSRLFIFYIIYILRVNSYDLV